MIPVCFSQREDVKSSFHATRHAGPWNECNAQVGSHFYTPTSAPSVRLLPELLTRLKILMFAGAEDLICVSVPSTSKEEMTRELITLGVGFL